MTAICTCDAFQLWYRLDDGTPVCRCGHAPGEHLDAKGPCVGEVMVQ